MMKKKILSIILAMIIVFATSTSVLAVEVKQETEPITYTVTVGEQDITFKEGESVTVPMVLTEEGQELLAKMGYVQPRSIVTGSAGTLRLNGQGFEVQWSAQLTIPYTDFTGYISTMDLTSGLSCGRVYIDWTYGTKKVCSISRHEYQAYISATAYFYGVPMAKSLTCSTRWRS